MAKNTLGALLLAALWMAPEWAWADKVPSPPPKKAKKAPAARTPAAKKTPAARVPAARVPAARVPAAKKVPKLGARVQDRKAPKARSKAQDAFKTVDLNNRKKSPHWDRPYMLVAYGLVWLFLMLYLMTLAARVRKQEHDLQRIEARVKEATED